MADLNGILLPDDIQWIDEFAWSKATQDKKYTAGGGLQLTMGRREQGQPMTIITDALLDGSSKDVTYAKVKLFQALRDANEQMTITLADNRVFSVMFDVENGHLEAEPVFDYAVKDDDDFYNVVLHLMIFQ